MYTILYIHVYLKGYVTTQYDTIGSYYSIPEHVNHRS